MRTAVLSDVHGNLHALEAVLAEVDAGGFDRLWFLGDLVGLGKIPIGAFAGDAAAAARWTQTVLADDARAFLDGLRPQAVTERAELYHGSPRDPVWDYVLSVDAAIAGFELTSAPLVLVGHSHVALELSDGHEIRGGQASPGTTLDLGAVRRLLNPGSVGQPRDGDPRAAWLEIDDSSGWATFRRTEYPVERTQAEMREAALPEALAARLAHGV